MWVIRHNIVDWVYFKAQTWRADLEDSKSTSERILCIFGSRTFVSTSWMCKKQTSVSHGSTQSEIISLDAGSRMDGSPALDLWDVVIEVLRSTNNTVKPNHDSIRESCARPNPKTKTPTNKRKHKVDQLSDVDHVPTNTHSSHGESQLYTFEDNEAVIKMIIKRRSPTMRHGCSRELA